MNEIDKKIAELEMIKEILSTIERNREWYNSNIDCENSDNEYWQVRVDALDKIQTAILKVGGITK